MDVKAADIREKLGSAQHSKQSLRLWLRMLTCTSVIEKRLRNRMRQNFETTLPRFDVLSTLEHLQKPLTMGDLSAHLMVSNGNVTGIVSRLEKEGMINRSIDPKDRRTHYISLTDKGLAEFSKMAKTHEEWIDNMFEDLADGEIADLLELLDKVRHSLTTANREGQ